jgi:NhaP-type Na+/H+ or K+/H+ antiporter
MPHVSTAAWFLLIGGLLLATGLTATLIRRLPVTPAIVYLAVGFIIGPSVLELFHFNPLQQHAVLGVITEIAVLLSLFTAGMKMPVPVRPRRWRAPVMLATVGMVVTVALMTGFGVWALGLPVGAAVLLAGALAPTDPVLATEVQARHPGDLDRLRFRLTCEAGLNDGSAFPVVMLGLALLGMHELGAFGSRWLLVDVLWFTVSGLVLGIGAGVGIGYLVWNLRRSRGGGHLMDEFIGLGLIGVVYGICLAIAGGGFLAVFFAAVALRHTEIRLGSGREAKRHAAIPRLTDGSLPFKEQLERLCELALVLLLGGMLFLNSWSWRAVATAAFLLLVARPLGTIIALIGSRAPRRMGAMIGWFGIRGTSSLYYVMLAIGAGVPEELALELIHLVLIVVTISIVVHGVSARPMLLRFWNRGAPDRIAPAATSAGSAGQEPVRTVSEHAVEARHP